MLICYFKVVGLLDSGPRGAKHEVTVICFAIRGAARFGRRMSRKSEYRRLNKLGS